MELFIYSGCASLPSIDYDCLRIAAYVKFKGIPVNITKKSNPYYSPNGFLPYLTHNDETIAGYDGIISYLQSQDASVSSGEYLSDSYLCQFESQFLPYFNYVLWGDPQNADETRILYAKRTPFPFNFTFPQKYIARASEVVQIVANFSINDKLEHHFTADMMLNAKKYINMLAERVEKKRWFFGGPKPDEIDASIYAALSILLNLPIPNNELKSHINECPHLVNYVDRIQRKYMSDMRDTEPAPSHTVLNRVQRVFVNKEKGTLSNGLIKILFGVLTVSTMVFFAISHGILEVVTDDDDLETAQYFADDDEHFSEE